MITGPFPQTLKARATHGMLGYTAGGKEQIAVELLILEGEHEGERLSWYGYFTEGTFARTLESLRLLGWRGDDLSDLSGIDENAVSIVVDEEEYNGERKVRVRWINAPGGLALKEPMTSDQAKAFAAKMRGRVLALSKGNGAKQPPQPAPRPTKPSAGHEPPPHSDDDIPF